MIYICPLQPGQGRFNQFNSICVGLLSLSNRNLLVACPTQQNHFYNCVNSSNPFPCYFTCAYGAKYDHKTTKNTLALLIVTGSLLARSIVSTISDAAKELEKSGLNYHHYHWKNICQRILMSANYMQLKSCRIILFYMSIYAGIQFFYLFS